MRLHLLFTSNIILAILAYFQISKNEVYTQSTSDVYTMEFVKVAGTEFLLNNKIWKPVGFNTYLLIEQAAELPYGSFNAIYSDGFGKKEILKQFEQAIFLNFTCVRTWFYSINSKYPLFIEDKVYDERLLGALDWVTAAARAHGLKLILSFTDFWPENGGIASLMLLSRKSIDLYSDHSEQHGKGSFFTDQNYFTLYIRHIEHLLLRRSKITGTRYCDESTVMAWELMVSLFFNNIYIIYFELLFLELFVQNEPRCRLCGEGILQKWILSAAKAVKSVDKRHLLTVGEEGFYASTKSYVNPAKWASDTGQNFIFDHLFAEIDYASSHLWTDNWNLFSLWNIKWVEDGSLNFSKAWIEEHSKDSLNILQKPFVLSEYGSTGFGNRNNVIGSLMTTEYRRQTKVCRFYSEVHAALLHNKNGALFWIWHHENLKYLPSYQDKYGIFASDNVFDNLKNYSRVLSS